MNESVANRQRAGQGASRLAAVNRRAGLLALAGGLGLSCGLMAPLTMRAEEPATVSLGIGGVHRTAAWTPLVVRMPATSATAVRAWVEDADGQFVGSPPAALAAEAGGMVARVSVRPGRPAVRVRLEAAGQGTGPMTDDPSASVMVEPDSGTAVPSTTPLWFVRGNLPAAAAAARLVAGEGRPPELVIFAPAPGEPPNSPRDLDAFESAILCGRTMGALEAPALAAIDGWIRRGGRLVLAAGESALALAAAGGPPAGWLPGSEPQLAPLRRLGAIEAFARSGGLAGRAPATGLAAPRFESPAGVVVVSEGAAAADLPLVIRRAHGFGTITWIGIDIDLPWAADWPGCDRLVAALLGGRSETERATVVGGDARRAATDLAGQLRIAVDSFAATEDAPASRPVSFEVIAGLGLLYCLALFPLDWWLVRRSGRPWLSWLTLPLIAGGFAAAAWGVGGLWGRDAPARLRVAEVCDVDAASGLVRCLTWAAVRSPANGLLDLAVAADRQAAVKDVEAAVSWFAPAGAGFGGVDAAVPHPSLAAGDYAYADSLADLRDAPIAAAASLSFEAEWTATTTVPAITASLVRDGRGLLAGRVTHHLPFPLERCWLVHGGWLYDAGRMEPGDTYDTEAGRGPRSLAAAVTRRAAVKDRDRAERWDPAGTDLDRILEVAGLHEAAGGPGYTGLEPGRLWRLDLSPLLAVDRAVLMGTPPAGRRLSKWQVRLHGGPAGDPAGGQLAAEGAAASLVRLVVPVAAAAESPAEEATP